MKKTVFPDYLSHQTLILHGTCDEDEYFEMDFPSPSNAHWLPWLQQKFLRAGFLCQTPEMPTPYRPVFEQWQQIFEQHLSTSLTSVVGHSAGCGFFLKWLSKHPCFHLDKLILVAPWLDTDSSCGEFLKFNLERNLLKNIKEIHLLFSEDDMPSVITATEMLIATFPQIKIHKFSDKGHFCFSTMGLQFEELWQLCC